MNVKALPEGLRRFTLEDLPRERWRNGKGWTRTVVCEERDGEVLWRVSLAEISQAAPFSQFPGMDRTAVLVGGGPVRLRGPERQWQLATPGDMACFAGELELQNERPGSEALIWNVMVRRGWVRADVQVFSGKPAGLATDADSLALVLYGSYRVMSPAGYQLFALTPGEGLHRGRTPAGLVLLPASAEASLVRTLLC